MLSLMSGLSVLPVCIHVLHVVSMGRLAGEHNPESGPTAESCLS